MSISARLPIETFANRFFKIRAAEIPQALSLTPSPATVLQAMDSSIAHKHDTFSFFTRDVRSLKLGRDQTTGMTAVLRFKVISTNAASTEIALQNLQVRDETGQPVEVNLPPAASIRIQ